jgi:polar amino acid transport system substrate-binding protein
MATAEALAGLRVLIVDDNEASRDVISSILQSFKFKVSTASSGQEALAEISSKNDKDTYDLIIMDYMMPGMDGIETTRRIHENNNTYINPKIIMLTAYGREDVSIRAEKEGIDGFLIKPVSSSTLLDMTVQVMDKDYTRIGVKKVTKEEMKMDITKLRGAKILLVEDNEINQELAMEVLKDAGLEVRLESNGKDAIDALNEEEFQCVLMDCQMPIMDGYEATAFIRENPKFSSLPIIAMTANAMEGEREKCLTAGMNDHISKPIDINKMYKTLMEWIISADSSTFEEPIEDNNVMNNDNKIEIPNLQRIDTEAGLRVANGNVELYKKILNIFKGRYSNFKVDFKNSQNWLEPSAAQRVAHTLKGTAGSIGAKELEKSAEELEMACATNKSYESVEQQLNHVVTILNLVLEELNKLDLGIAADRTNVNEVFDIHSIEPLIQDLKAKLIEDSSSALKVYQEIIEKVKGTEAEEKFKNMGKYIKMYDFDSALELFDF